MHMARANFTDYTTIRLDDLLGSNMFSINENNTSGNYCGLGYIFKRLKYTENSDRYVWGKPLMRMMLEVQCLAVAIIVCSQVWILAYYGNRVFEKLVGDDIALPLLYLAAIIFGSMTYVRPTYWRIVMSLTLYCLVAYFSMMVTNMAVRILVTPGLAEALQSDPGNTRVWVPWSIGFALHLQITISSCIISFLSFRDMYAFSPVILTDNNEESELYAKHNINLEPITILHNNNNNPPARDSIERNP